MTISKEMTYETTELKLAALVLATIPKSSFKIYESKHNSIRKNIKITYAVEYKNIVTKLQDDYLNKDADVNVFLYNRALNMIRNELRKN